MARYSYPIRHGRRNDILAVATSATNAVELIDQYAGKLSKGAGPSYGTTLNGDALKQQIAKDGKVEVQLLAYNGERRHPDDDETVKVCKVEVNALLD